MGPEAQFCANERVHSRMKRAAAVNLELETATRFDIGATVLSHCQACVLKLDGKVGEMDLAARIAPDRDRPVVVRRRADNFATIGSTRYLTDDEGHGRALTSRRTR
jgi:hypothetical protein